MALLFAECVKKNADYNFVKTSIDQKEDVNWRDPDNQISLMPACENSRHDIVALLIEAKANVNAFTSHRGEVETALFFALRAHNVNIVTQLLEAKADTEITTWYEKSPLMHEVFCGSNTLIISKLIEYRADINTRCCHDETALMMAGIRWDQNVTIMLQLLEARAEIHSRDKFGMTALMKACCKFNSSAVYHLLKFDKQVNAQDPAGETALMKLCNFYEFERIHSFSDIKKK
jgi:ankyrin repeat protein